MWRSNDSRRITIRVWIVVSIWLLSGGLCVFWARADDASRLPGTAPLEAEGDLATKMVAGIDRFLLEQTTAATQAREQFWNRDFTSHETYARSVAVNRQRLKRIIGAADARVSFTAPQLIATVDQSARVATGDGYEVLSVRWPAFGKVWAEGLLLRPLEAEPVADLVAIPDADHTPEMIAGLLPGVAPESHFARRLAESGCRVLVPTLIDRNDRLSVVGGTRATNQPHREFIYRQAYEMGRHLIGYEVQKVLAGVDWFENDAKSDNRDARVGVIGFGEGGLVALYAGAIDQRIDAVLTSGYLDSRRNLWQEPIYRNVFSLLREFGDAELAGLIAPRTLIVEAAAFPNVAGPPPPRLGRSGAAPGRLATPSLEAVRREVERARSLVSALSPPARIELIASGDGPAGSDAALATLLDALAPAAELASSGGAPKVLTAEFDLEKRLERQFDQLVEHTQYVMRESEFVRREFWSEAETSSLDSWQKTVEPLREHFYEEVIGRFDEPFAPANPRTRKIYDEPMYVGYEVVVDVFEDVFAYGILLVPKDIAPRERRPVVVCQHGLEGRPQDVADPAHENPSYHRYACRLAERGFVTYAPQNPYIGRDLFRTLQRKANPLGKTLFSVIVPQHQVTVDWLASLPFVDQTRIAFYGLSYGGKTAMRVPPLVKGYCLSICSADFNEWIWKNVTTRHTYSYLGTGEYEMFEFDLGNTFNYAELAALITPRPFMVERGHHDGVAPDEWVAYEFAKVRRLYAALGIPDRTEIEFFDGPHTINGKATFDFLHRHLNWPKR